MAVTTVESVVFPEQGFRGVKVEFKDDDGAAVTPNTGTVTWTLSDKPADLDEAPTIINSREQVAITSASTIYISLEGADLTLQAGEAAYAFAQRVLTIEFQYDSSNYGTNKDDKAQYIFSIQNMHYPS